MRKEPFFFDEAEAVADHKRRLLREEEELRQRQIFENRLDRVTGFDPKQGGLYYPRFGFYDLAIFDPEEECKYIAATLISLLLFCHNAASLGPMRYTDRVYKGADDPELVLYPGINVLSVKIVTLDDLKFPIHVYGTVVARDSLDRKCVYLFRRDEDQCQVINSESESLILCGPKRGLVLIDDTYVEIDLKIKDPRWQSGVELSKGYVSVRSIRRMKNVVESKSLESRLSTVEVMYAVEKDAVEATIDFEVLRGKFYGEITACTTSIPESLVLHDSKVAGKLGGCRKGTIQLLRSVITVDIKDMLIIRAMTCVGNIKRIQFTPMVNSSDHDVFTFGATQMRVKVTWSTID
ncbi:hypothetical protein PR202_ga13432 [Eleusine coracana subsp. coracana]|uniref:DUF6598 domain-containing protein n=1 Tax=Eleusine coracana subsp. coracana TaxID=191504 RepID=A0AAV5CEY4_ELECO|nr:hypothetical protein PR202_ga13432 [Eleusine coracana subsp. coracana]